MNSVTVILLGLALFSVFAQIEGKAGNIACKDKDVDSDDRTSLKQTAECLTSAAGTEGCDAAIDLCLANAGKGKGCGGKSKMAGKFEKMLEEAVKKAKKLACSVNSDDIKNFKSMIQGFVKKGKDMFAGAMNKSKSRGEQAGE